MGLSFFNVIRQLTTYQGRYFLKCTIFVHLVKAMVFPVVTYGCESWTIEKDEHGRTDAFELWCWRSFLSPLDCKEIKPVNPKRNQSWIFIGRTDAEAEAPILWPTDANNGLIGKDPDTGKDWRWEEKGTTEDKIVRWYHQLERHEFGQALGVGDGQGNLVCWSPWGHKESDMTEQLNWTIIAKSQTWRSMQAPMLKDLNKQTPHTHFLALYVENTQKLWDFRSKEPM